MNTKSFIIAILLTIFVAIIVSKTASAEDFKQKHPRRAQVLNRANNQKNKNNAAAANGQITDKQAQKLDHQDNKIKKEEQTDARANGGHITKGEQAQLNRQENHVNQERNNMEAKDAAGNTAPAAPAPGQ